MTHQYQQYGEDTLIILGSHRPAPLYELGCRLGRERACL